MLTLMFKLLADGVATAVDDHNGIGKWFTLFHKKIVGGCKCKRNL